MLAPDDGGAAAAGAKEDAIAQYLHGLLNADADDVDDETAERLRSRVPIVELEADTEYRVGGHGDDDSMLQVHRKGVEQSPVGVYRGEFVNGMREGRGAFTYANGDVYIGA